MTPEVWGNDGTLTLDEGKAVFSVYVTTKYLEFKIMPKLPGRKTRQWQIISRNHGDVLGGVGWFGRWRQYTFHPTPNTVFNPICMREIADFCEAQTKNQRKGISEYE